MTALRALSRLAIGSLVVGSTLLLAIVPVPVSAANSQYWLGHWTAGAWITDPTTRLVIGGEAGGNTGLPTDTYCYVGTVRTNGTNYSQAGGGCDLVTTVYLSHSSVAGKGRCKSPSWYGQMYTLRCRVYFVPQ